jgi:phosphatidylserine/phosphatidylglycerophosphate/cardiolipin synthase-like enzyme
MLHAKTVLVDNRVFKVGSSNLNASSLNSNYELDLLIEDDDLTQAAAAQFRHDLARSVEVVLRAPRWGRGPLAGRVPPAVVDAAPRPEVNDHQPWPGERSRRAVVTLRRVAAGARRSIAGATVFGLLGAGVLFLALPRAVAYVLAVACFWLAASAAWRFLRRHGGPDE